MRARQLAVYVAIAAIFAGLTPVLLGCGGGGGGGDEAPADVALTATITAHSAGSTDGASVANTIDSVILQTVGAGDTVDISEATAQIVAAGGGSTAVTMNANGTGTQVTLGQAVCSPSTTALNVLRIDGPVRVTDGQTGTTTTIGRLQFGMECLADGTVVSPDTITVDVPTRGAATDRRVQLTGLEPNTDFVQTIITDNGGGKTISATQQADAGGDVTIQDAHGSITAEVLSGNNSIVEMNFARTDSNSDGEPDLF